MDWGNIASKGGTNSCVRAPDGVMEPLVMIPLVGGEEVARGS